MYSLHLTCTADQIDALAAELWELGTAGIRELDTGEGVTLIAGFENNEERVNLLERFAGFSPEWELEEAVDWVQWTHESWPPREVGKRLFLAPHWSETKTPQNRLRLVHNPGLACGTGEHPCTQLALAALESVISPGCSVLDIGTGSGILAIAAKLLGAATAIAVDPDFVALKAAQENFALNHLDAPIACGSADAIAGASFDLTLANISGTVLLSIFDDLLRVTKPEGHLILTGFAEWELSPFLQLLPAADVSEMNEWRCITVRLS